MPDRKCNYCEEYDKSGHNYCRMCGYYLKKGIVHNVRIAVAFNTSEKYCGYCGKLRKDCKC